jgi:hypothetical protein
MGPEFPGGTKKDVKNRQSRLRVFRAEIWTQELSYQFAAPFHNIQESVTNGVSIPMCVINTRVASPKNSKLPFLQ